MKEYAKQEYATTLCLKCAQIYRFKIKLAVGSSEQTMLFGG
jgi:RNase P subunit RPR2